MKGGLKDEDLKELANTLESGQYGLVAIYATNMADQIAANIKAVNRFVSSEVEIEADELAAQLKAAEASDS